MLGNRPQSGEVRQKTLQRKCLSLIDDCVGRVVGALENRGWLNDTRIVFSSDHGEMLGDHGLMAKKVFHDGAVNVPCIFRPPSGGVAWQSNALTDHLDIAATLLDITGSEAFAESDGSSLMPLIRAGENATDAPSHKEAVLSEIGVPPHAFSMVRTDRYKMAVNATTREPLDLYDMLDDPRELHNRVNDPALRAVREGLIEFDLARLLPESS